MTNVLDEIGNGIGQKIGSVHGLYRPPRTHLKQVGKMIAPLNDVEREGIRRMAGRLAEVRIDQARRNPNAFIEYCFTDDEGNALRQSWFHEAMQELMDRPGRVAMALPRDHGKSTAVVARIIWELGRNPNLRVKIVAETDQRAKDRLYQIAMMIVSNRRVREVFPNLIPDQEGSWTKGRFYVRRQSQQRDPSVEASGVLSSATGGRCDLLVGDDVVGRKTALTQPGYREEVKRAWHSDWENIVEPTGRTWYIFTPWHHDDLSHDILGNRLYAKLVVPVEEPFGSIWPERYPESVLRERYELIGPIEYARAFLLKPSSASEQIVQSEWLQFFDPAAVDLTGYKIILSYDLASAQSKMADYTACVVGALSGDAKRLLILDAWRDRMPFPTLLGIVKGDVKAFGAEVLAESVQYQRALAQTLAVDEPWITCHQCFPIVNKAERLRAVTPYLVKGAVQFSQALRERTPDHKRGDLLHEILEFGIARHDDMADAFTQLVIWTAEKRFQMPSVSQTLGCRVMTFTDARDDAETASDASGRSCRNRRMW